MLLRLFHYPIQFSSKTLDSQSTKLQNPKPIKLTIRSSSTGSITGHGTIDGKSVGKSAIQRISEKLRSLGYIEEEKKSSKQSSSIQSGSAGEIFLPSSEELQNRRVGYTLDSSWSTPHNPVPKPGSGTAITRYNDLKIEVEKQRRRQKSVEKEPKVPTLAELTIPREELRRLRTIGIAEKKKLNVGKAGITEGIVNGIHERWRRSEVVKIRCEDLCRWNMKRTHDLLERKTGGLVVWRSGSIIVLYRGVNYKYPYFLADGNMTNIASDDQLPSEPSVDCAVDSAKDSSVVHLKGANPALPSPVNGTAHSSLVHGVGLPSKVRFQLPGEAQLAEEVDHLLDGLGPRFTDWWGDDPFPVDADLLPAIVPGYRKPFRLLPYGIRPKLTNDEMTTLKRLSRHLPYQFALGRNRNLQGLAASMIKLWEKCEIAKIAVKRGIQNTNSKMMAEELKLLTGGTLIARAGEFIVFYRGKDFLPPAVSTAMNERRKSRLHMENGQTTDQSSNLDTIPELEPKTNKSPSVDQDIQINDQDIRKLKTKEGKLRSTSTTVRSISTKLSMALEKKAKAEKLLEELEKTVEAPKPEVDREGITKEERYMLKRVGLRMKPYLPMGRRGVFDGTIENMHLHWKYRELVKIISKDRCIEDAHGTARTLEAESGGILVAVERARKGYAIIIYRGKNYMRPVDLRPQTLLNKKQALKRSLEAQRNESLKLHILKLAKNIEHLKHQVIKDEMEMKSVHSTERERPDSESEACDGPTLANYSHQQANADSVESANVQEKEHIKEFQKLNVIKDNASDSLLLHSNPWMGAPICKEAAIQLDERIDACSQSYQSAETEQESSSEPVSKATLSTTSPEGGTWMGDSVCREDNLELDKMIDCCSQSERKSLSEPIPRVTHSSNFPDGVEIEAGNDSSDFSVNLLGHISGNELMESSVKFDEDEFKSSVQRDEVRDGSDVKGVFRSVALSNRDRLLLRKQALKMKKRPILAVGKSNLVTGVAKAIKAHFEKHPLAIVNVKGRAKGTSIQELVFELEKATGAVLVSQEPNKVILYRGWGDTKEPGVASDKRNAKRASTVRDDSTLEVVSPQLIEAIRLECGLDDSQDEETTL